MNKPTKLCTFEEMLQPLREGRKVRLQEWDAKSFMWVSPYGLKITTTTKNKGILWQLDWQELNSTEWSVIGNAPSA